MLELTTIIHNNKVALNLDAHLNLKQTVGLARAHGLKGRLQIEYKYLIIQKDKAKTTEDIIITMYCIDSQDKTICAVYPYKNNKKVRKYA